METRPQLELPPPHKPEPPRVLGVIINLFLPGVGTLIVGRMAEGVLQIVIDIVATILTFTVIFSPVALGMFIVVWLWGLVSAATV